MKRISAIFFVLVLATLACGQQVPAMPFPTPETSIFEANRTAYGFFPSPPEASLDSILNHYKSLGEHADFVLFQHPIPWEDFPKDNPQYNCGSNKEARSCTSG